MEEVTLVLCRVLLDESSFVLTPLVASDFAFASVRRFFFFFLLFLSFRFVSCLLLLPPLSLCHPLSLCWSQLIDAALSSDSQSSFIEKVRRITEGETETCLSSSLFPESSAVDIANLYHDSPVQLLYNDIARVVKSGDDCSGQGSFIHLRTEETINGENPMMFVPTAKFS